MVEQGKIQSYVTVSLIERINRTILSVRRNTGNRTTLMTEKNGILNGVLMQLTNKRFCSPVT